MALSFGSAAEVACHVVRAIAGGAQNAHVTVSAACNVEGVWLPGVFMMSWVPGSGEFPDVKIRSLYTDSVPTPTLEAFLRRAKVLPKTFRVLQDVQTAGEWHIVTLEASDAAKFVENLLTTETPYKPSVMLGKRSVVTTSGGVPQVQRVAFTRPDIRGTPRVKRAKKMPTEVFSRGCKWWKGVDQHTMNAAEVAASALVGSLVLEGPTRDYSAYGLGVFASAAKVADLCRGGLNRAVDEETPALSELAAHTSPSRIAFQLCEVEAGGLRSAAEVVLRVVGKIVQTKLELADFAVSLYSDDRSERRWLRAVLIKGPVLANKAAREAFLRLLLKDTHVKELCVQRNDDEEPVLLLAPFYGYRTSVPLIWCPRKEDMRVFWPQTPESVHIFGSSGEGLDNEPEVKCWDSGILGRHMFTAVPAGAERLAGLQTTSVAPVLGELGRRALTVCRAKGLDFDEADVIDVIESSDGFRLELKSLAPKWCPAANEAHAAGTAAQLTLENGLLSFTCRAPARCGALKDDVAPLTADGLPQASRDRVGHGECCCITPLGVLLPLAFPADIQVEARLPVPDPHGVPRNALLTKQARDEFRGFISKDEPVVVDTSEVGMGKTFAAIEAIVEHVHAERKACREVWVVVVESHVLLVGSFFTELNKRLILEELPIAIHYDEKKDEKGPLRLGVVVTTAHSVHRVLRSGRSTMSPDKRPRLLVICDEPVASLSMFSSMASDGATPETHIWNLAELFELAHTLIVCDATASPGNVGHLLALAGISKKRVFYTRTNAHPSAGQEVRVLIGISEGKRGKPVFEPFGCAVELGRILAKPHAPSVFCPVATVKVGRILEDFVKRRFPNATCFFLWAKAHDTAELLKQFEALEPKKGVQNVFIASPSLVTGVSHAKGAFQEVFEVLSAFTTSALDSEQKRARARVWRGIAPKVTIYVADERIANAIVPKWDNIQYDPNLNADLGFSAHVASRLLDYSSAEAACAALKMASFLNTFGVPANLQVSGEERAYTDSDAYYLVIGRKAYRFTQRKPAELKTLEEVKMLVTAGSRHATAARRIRGEISPSSVIARSRGEVALVSSNVHIEALLLGPKLEEANRPRTILTQIHEMNLAARRTVLPTEVRVYPDAGEEREIIEEAQIFAKVLSTADFADKANYVTTRLLFFGEPRPDGPLFLTREDYYAAMKVLQEEEKAPNKKRKRPKENKKAADEDEGATERARDALLMPGEGETIEVTEHKHRRWQLEILQQVLTFNEKAVLDVAHRVASVIDEDGARAAASADWTKMHDTQKQAEFRDMGTIRLIAERAQDPYTAILAEYSRRATGPGGAGAALSTNLPKFLQLVQLEELLQVFGFTSGWRCTDTTQPAFKRQYTDRDLDEREGGVMVVVGNLSGRKVPRETTRLVTDVARLVAERSSFVKIQATSPGGRMYAVLLDPMFRRYMFGEEFQDVELPGCSWRTARHSDFWREVFKERAAGVSDKAGRKAEAVNGREKAQHDPVRQQKALELFQNIATLHAQERLDSDKSSESIAAWKNLETEMLGWTRSSFYLALNTGYFAHTSLESREGVLRAVLACLEKGQEL